MEKTSEQISIFQKGKPVYFISDAHLSFENGQIEDKLVNFLNSIIGKAGYLYILGDLFDFWLEYKHVVPSAYLKTLAALLKLKQAGVEIVYLPGNHDFWLGNYLHKQVGITLAGDQLEIDHHGKKIHLYHGDGLAYGDYGYRLLKKLFRFKPNIWLYKLMPVDWAYRLAHRTSGASREYTSKKPKDLRGYYDYAAEKIKSGCDAVIMGHTHVPEIKKLDNGLYINTGDWLDHFSYVVLENGEFKLEYYKEKE
ncbi:MAG: UDP-2,3-diacylglucosamine diphosphatase [candidate division Zixibacteria bacterium]|nr:UDP-2,3-diacylglucosamine diphosphatase [candidate division Zixibacteria bacterium]